MKDDFGKSWKLNEYLMAAFGICLILLMLVFVANSMLFMIMIVGEKYILHLTFATLTGWFIVMVIFTLHSNKKRQLKA